MTGSMNARLVDSKWRPVVGIAPSARQARFGDSCVIRGSLPHGWRRKRSFYSLTRQLNIKAKHTDCMLSRYGDGTRSEN